MVAHHVWFDHSRQEGGYLSHLTTLPADRGRLLRRKPVCSCFRCLSWMCVTNSYHCYFLCYCCLLWWVATSHLTTCLAAGRREITRLTFFHSPTAADSPGWIYFLWLEISSIMSVVRSLGKIAPSTSALFLCDMQVVLTKKKPFQRVNRFPGEVPPNDFSLWRGGSKQCAGSRCRCSHGNAHCCHRAVSKVSLSLSFSLWRKSLWSSLPFFRGLGPTVPELELEKFGVKVQISL